MNTAPARQDAADGTTSEYTLYCFAQSGNAYKAALMPGHPLPARG